METFQTDSKFLEIIHTIYRYATDISVWYRFFLILHRYYLNKSVSYRYPFISPIPIPILGVCFIQIPIPGISIGISAHTRYWSNSIMDPMISGLNRCKRKYGPFLAAIAALYVTMQNVLLLSFLSRNVKSDFINCDSSSILENGRLLLVSDEFQSSKFNVLGTKVW